MSALAYDDVLSDVERLSPEEKLRMMEQLAILLRRRVAPRAKHSIMELQGLGKEIWQGIDAKEYVNRERESWR